MFQPAILSSLLFGTEKSAPKLSLIYFGIFLEFLNFPETQSANRFFSTDNIRETLSDDFRRESFLDSLGLVKDDRALLTTILDPSFSPEKDIAFHLYTRENPSDPYTLKLNDSENLQTSPFDPHKTTKIIVHGWTDSGNSYWVKDMRRNYINAGDYNVISMDWYTGSIKEYFVCARLTKQVGQYLGDFLEYLKTEANLSYPKVHIIGHSLGAHIAGYAGAAAASKIGRITGLDPARPAFEAPVFKGQKDRLDPSDAQFVDVIHTCAGTAGFVRAVGHVDFYPNGGSFRQPGCSVIISQYCSHGRSHQFMTESILASTDFVAVKCDSWSDYKAEKCMDNPMLIMGENVDHDSRGKYFLETNAESPFAQGIQIPDDSTQSTS